MLIFNAFQLTILLSAWPFIIGWLKTEPFAYSGALVWVAIVAYIVNFVFNVCAVSESLRRG
jgi:hypothetical protein